MKLLAFFLGFVVNFFSLVFPKLGGIIALKLFCYPARPTLQPKHKSYLLNAQSEDWTLGGKKVKVYKWGDGKKKILLVHGWQGHSFRWKQTIEFFNNEEYCFYALDAPGHGLSPGRYLHVPLYAEVIRDFLVKRKIDFILAHSLGAFATLHTIQQNPKLCPQKLVTLGAPRDVEDFIAVYRKILNLNDRSIRRLHKRFMERFGQTTAFYKAEKFAQHCPCPSLVIHDRQDKDVKYSDAEIIAAALPKGHLWLTKGFGHGLKGEVVLKGVKAFLEEGKLPQ